MVACLYAKRSRIRCRDQEGMADAVVTIVTRGGRAPVAEAVIASGFGQALAQGEVLATLACLPDGNQAIP